MHNLIVHYGLKMGERPAKAEENLINAQYNCALYDGSDYKCTELLCNKAAPAAIAQQKPPENTCPPAKQCAASNGGFLYVPCFLFIIRSQQTIDQPPLFFAGAMMPMIASLKGLFL